MALISCQNLRIAFGGRPLLDGVNLQIEAGERIGLMGRNGEGKSTLLSILAEHTEPDDGLIVRASGLKVAFLEQQLPKGLHGSASDIIGSGLVGDSEGEHPVQRLCSLLQIDGKQSFTDLSGGMKRRTLLARALASEPDILLLDEPTNHLDLDSIQWLENFLTRFKGSFLFVTHDRAFLQRLSTRIIELDRGHLTSWACNYSTYLKRKEELLANEEKEWEHLDRTLAREEVWIRQGIKARRTRNEGRVRALKKLRTQRAERRERVGQVRLNIQQAGRSWARVITTDKLEFSWDDAPVVKDLSTTLIRGDKVGIIGPNGCGKTTLLNLLLKQLDPSGGRVKHGGALEVAYFDQHREQLDESRSIAESITDGSEVVLDGVGRHIMTYLQDFLFSPEQARQPVGSLSGGERNRLLLARLFTRPANVLVLDEPTNDLDLETLELLEARLHEFDGTVLVVSHDRSFLDNLCSNTLVFEGGGAVKEYVGGYSDWQRVVSGRTPAEEPGKRKTKGRPTPRPKMEDPTKPKRLSFKERREWEALPGRIESLEEELEALHGRMAAPEFFKGDPEGIKEASEMAQALPEKIDSLLTRWAELDERSGE